MKSSLVSIIVPCYNQARYLPEAIASLQAQTYTHWECLLINDGSTDDTTKVGAELAAADDRIRVISQSNRGLSGTRNRGLDESKGEYIQFLDADDVLKPDKFSMQIEVLRSAKDLALAYCDYYYASEKNLDIEKQDYYKSPRFRSDDLLTELISQWETQLSIPCHCFLFDARFFTEHGIRFDEALQNHEDWDCWMRIFAMKPTVDYVDARLAVYRLHSQSSCRDSGKMRRGYLTAIEKQLEVFSADRVKVALLKTKRREVKWAYRYHGELHERLWVKFFHGGQHLLRRMLKAILPQVGKIVDQPQMVYVTAYLGGCHGTAKSARDFLRALLACSYNVIVLSPNRDKMPCKIGEYELSEPKWLVTHQERQYRRRSIRYWLDLPHELYHHLKRRFYFWCLNRRNHDTVIVNGWASLCYWQKYASRLKSKKVIIIRESPRHFVWGDCNVDFNLMLKGLAQFDGLIFVSDNGRQEWLGYPELTKIPNFYIPNCCEEEEAKELLKRTRLDVRKELGLNPDEFIIICPGTIEKRKGQDLLLEILPELCRVIPRLRLLIVGGAGTLWGRQFLEQLSNNPFADQITHWHFRQCVLDAIYASDLLAIPSRAEAFPRTILEAMVLKTPIVASDVDGIPEQIDDKKTGYLFHTEDKDGLLNALTTLATNERIRVDIAEAGFKRYWDRYSRQHQIKHVNDIISDLRERI